MNSTLMRRVAHWWIVRVLDLPRDTDERGALFMAEFVVLARPFPTPGLRQARNVLRRYRNNDTKEAT